MRYCRKYLPVLSFSSITLFALTRHTYMHIMVDAHLIGGPSNTQSVDEDTGILHANDQPHELLIYWQRKWAHYSHCTSAPTASKWWGCSFVSLFFPPSGTWIMKGGKIEIKHIRMHCKILLGLLKIYGEACFFLPQFIQGRNYQMQMIVTMYVVHF